LHFARDLSRTNSVTCAYARDITFKNVRLAAQNNPFVEDHSQAIRRMNWIEVPLVPTTQ
jgi:hypothetical protein